jgi:hypothetical protein
LILGPYGPYGYATNIEFKKNKMEKINSCIDDIGNALQDLGVIKTRCLLFPFSTIADMVRVFQQHNFVVARDDVVYDGEVIDVERHAHAPLEKRVCVSLTHGRVTLVVRLYERQWDLHMGVSTIHMDGRCHMETNDRDVITLEDVARAWWYSCANNNYWLGDRSAVVLGTLQARVGAGPEWGWVSRGYPIPEHVTVLDQFI